jgi:hypothetical protein
VKGREGENSFLFLKKGQGDQERRRMENEIKNESDCERTREKII